MKGSLKILDGIELKIRQLVEKLKILKIENKEILKENALLNNEIEKLKINIEELKSKASPAKEVNILNNGDLFENQEIRVEIDSYIDEIDKCIEILKLN